MKKWNRVMAVSVAMSMVLAVPVYAKPSISELEQEKAKKQAEVEQANAELVMLLTDYGVLKSDIKRQQDRIEQADKDLREAEKTEQKQYEDMKLRIKYMYEEGDYHAIEKLITAQSFAEILNGAEYIQSVHGYDRNKLKQYTETKEEVAALKLELEADQADMEKMADDLKEQQKNLESTLDVMREELDDFDTQLAAAQKAAAEEQKRLEQETAQGVANAGGGKPSKPNGGKPAENLKPENKPQEPGKPQQPSKPQEPGKPQQPKPQEPKPQEPKPQEPKPQEPKPQEPSKPTNTAKGQKIVDIACNYIGNKYVYGGTDLENGIDCSGFTQAIHAKVGIYIPRDSASQRFGGKAVNGLANALPGDVICYSGHVAIYMGNNAIVHASNSAPYPAGGIKISYNAGYKTILAIRRYW